MFKRISYFLLGAYLFSPLAAFALTPKEEACKGATGSTTCATPGGTLSLTDGFKSVANILIFIVGAVSVIMIIIGGLRYVLSGGDSAGVKSAKDTILYAIIGVIVAALAFAAVNFVVSRV
jgi:hypothetical protein